MNIQEFEALTGKSLSAEEYAKYERAYMNASQLFDKQRFCNAISKANPETLDLIFDLSGRVSILSRIQENMSKTGKAT